MCPGLHWVLFQMPREFQTIRGTNGACSLWWEASSPKWSQTQIWENRKAMRGERRRKKEEETGGATGGTYCQVGPRGVARVAPLSDSTHKREVGKTLAVCQKLGQRGNKSGGKRDKSIYSWWYSMFSYYIFKCLTLYVSSKRVDCVCLSLPTLLSIEIESTGLDIRKMHGIS